MNDENPPIDPIRWPAPILHLLTLRWDGSNWSIESRQRVQSMTLPAPDPLPEGENSRGFWVEAIDRQGRVRHREVMADPLAGMEQFDEGGEVSRLLHGLHDLTIEVLVPDLPELAEIHLVSNPAAAREGHDPSQGARRTKLRIGRKPKKPDRDPEQDDEHDHPGRHP